MKTVECRKTGDVVSMVLLNKPTPIPRTGEVLISVFATGINRPDLLQRKGLYPPPANASPILGLEVAGTIESGDEAAMKQAGLQLGDAVCALVPGGGYASFCIAPVLHCLPIPKNWTMSEAASIPETYFTVWSNLVDLAHLQTGQSVLIHGGASGIGVAAIQIAKKILGASQVLVTAGSNEKCQACQTLGADIAINYHEQDFEVEVAKATKNQGVNVIIDMVAGSYVARNIRSLADDGKLVIIAAQGGRSAEFDAATVLIRRLSIHGSTLRRQSDAYKADIARALRMQVWPKLATREIVPVVHEVLKVSDEVGNTCEAAMRAHEILESSMHIGKVILDWSRA